jgi:serine/threonine-protein kinase
MNHDPLSATGNLPPKTQFGVYRIEECLGAGGMGVVYRATDTKLERSVALKFIRSELLHDDGLSRFAREARLLASLSHPHIAAIHGMEESSGVPFLVLEYVPGPTLAERLRRGALPVGEAVRLARQIAEALEAAHAKGIIHRDLKPANIKVDGNGDVRVLDFGLAKSIRPRSLLTSGDTTVGMSSSLTGAPPIIGTAPYMSPEQAAGKEVDARADIWAFGTVLYEMLTGERAFRGETITDVLASVMKEEPRWDGVPAKVRPLLRRCLEKDARNRLRNIGDAMALVEIGAEVSGAPAEAAPNRAQRLPWMVAAALFLLAASAGIGLWRAGRTVEPPQLRLDVDFGPDVAFAAPFGSLNLIPSPDGSSILYVGTVAGGQPRLYLRKLDQDKSIELPGTDGANSPFFSPDGRWAGFSIGGKLYKIALDGGAPVLLSAPGVSMGSAWGEDGAIVTAVLLKGLVSTSASGGAPEMLTEVDSATYNFKSPQWLPGGKALLYTTVPSPGAGPASSSVEVFSLPNHKKKVVVAGGVSGRYVGASRNSGYLLYTVNTTMFAVPFGLSRLEKSGAPVAVLDDVGVRQFEESQFDVSRTGTLVYRRSSGDATQKLTTIKWLDTTGKSEQVVSEPGRYRVARLSPAGKRLLVGVAGVVEGRVMGAQVYDVERETWIPLPGGAHYIDFTWSADGQFVLLGSPSGLSWTRADGAGQPRRMMPGDQRVQVPSSISDDGKRLAYTDGVISQAQIWTMSVESVGAELKAGTPEPFLKSALQDGSRDLNPAFSPDGKWLAYMSNLSGVDEVYVRAFPDKGNLWKISNSGGTRPLWSRGTHELLYQLNGQVLAVNWSEKNGAFVPEKPRVWAAKAGGTVTDLSADGRRMLVVAPVNSAAAGPEPEHHVMLFQNFLEYLRQHVPGSK